MKAKISALLPRFSRVEWALWGGSAFLVLGAFLLLGRGSWLILAASLIGVTSLIFNAKGSPLGQLLMILFSLLYGVISLAFRYYGEMLTYLGMTAPMAVFALVSWLRHPYAGNQAQVEVAPLSRRGLARIALLTAGVTLAFYYILAAFHTANLALSTLSVATSFLAAALTFRRSAFFALAYAANDLVLMGLWALASLADHSYLPVLACFALFFVNDLYGFFSWRKMERLQKSEKQQPVA